MRKLKVLLLLPLLALSGCRATSSTGVPPLRQANYDLSSGLNHATQAIIQLEQQGVITVPDANPVLSIIGTMTTESDAINKCIDNAEAGASPNACVQAQLSVIATQTAQASVGIKSTNAQLAADVILNGITAIFSEFSSAGVTVPTVTALPTTGAN